MLTCRPAESTEIRSGSKIHRWCLEVSTEASAAHSKRQRTRAMAAITGAELATWVWRANESFADCSLQVWLIGMPAWRMKRHIEIGEAPGKC